MMWFLLCCTGEVIEKKKGPLLVEHQKKRLSGSFLSCRKYASPEIFSYCIYQKSEHLTSLEDVQYYCTLTGEWEEACRHVWGAKMVRAERGLTFNQLMEGCAGFSDCAFEILDALPSKEVQKQINLCVQYVEADQKDCIGHAMQRWVNSDPTRLEVNAFLEEHNHHTPETLHFIALISLCRPLDVCTGDSQNAKKCRMEKERLENQPHVCREKWGDMRK
jgi:hypothetical protein